MPEVKVDQRKYKRVNICIPVSLKELRHGYNHDHHVNPADIKNISASGMRITHDEFIHLGNLMVIEVHIQASKEVIRAISRVVWVKKSDEEGKYDLGNHFVHMTKSDLNKLACYVKNTDAQSDISNRAQST